MCHDIVPRLGDVSNRNAASPGIPVLRRFDFVPDLGGATGPAARAFERLAHVLSKRRQEV